MMTANKATLLSSSTVTAVGTTKSMTKEDSLVRGLLDSSITDILAGNFTLYGSDIFAITSLAATLTMVAWRIHYDTKPKVK